MSEDFVIPASMMGCLALLVACLLLLKWPLLAILLFQIGAAFLTMIVNSTEGRKWMIIFAGATESSFIVLLGTLLAMGKVVF